MTISEKMRRILHLTVRLLDDNKVFASVVPTICAAEIIRRQCAQKAQSRTFGFRFLLTRLITESSEGFSPANLLIAGRMYSIIEAYVLNLTVTDR